jgi:hypothetical protein
MVHRLPEVGCGPSAYSGPSVWRDIGGDNCAKWRVNGFAPCKRLIYKGFLTTGNGYFCVPVDLTENLASEKPI